MRKIALLLMVALGGGLLLSACGDDDNGTGPTSAQIDTVYVDVANAGTEDGSSAHPYNTITEAVVAVSEGDLLLIAAGEYSAEDEYIHLKGGMTIRGADADSTRIHASFTGPTDHDTRPVTLEDLHCEGFSYGLPAATSRPSGTSALKRCHIDGEVAVVHGGGYSMTVDSCTVAEAVRFGHSSGNWVNRDAVRWCTVGGSIRFGNVGMTAAGNHVQVVIGCHVAAGIQYVSANGAVDTIRNNTVDSIGIDYRSAASDAYIAYNIIVNGQIYDASGAGPQLIVHNQVSYDGSNGDLDPILIKESGASATIKHNTLIGGSDITGIRLYSGDTTICDSNYVRTFGEAACIETKAGFGQIIGNTLIGGWFGIDDDSRTAEIAYNTIDSCNYGVLASGEGRYHHNTISNSNYDGMALSGAVGPIDHNTVTNSSWAGIRIILSGADLGGGPDGSVGGNTVTGSGDWDFVNETADTIWAKHNTWDHADSTAIDVSDIYDDDNNAARGPVIFMPID